MQLSKPVAVVVLLATLVPLAYLVFFLTALIFAVMSGPQRGPEPTLFKVVFVLHIVCMLWIWTLLAFYIVYLFKSSAMPNDQRVLWAVVLFFFNMLAMPVFWYLYIWPASQRAKLEPPKG